MQMAAMRNYAKKRRWTVVIEVKDVGSGATTRPKREKLIESARRREIDLVLVWRLDRWGRFAGGSGQHASGVDGVGSGFRFIERSVGLDHSERAGSGRDAGGVRGVRKGYSA